MQERQIDLSEQVARVRRKTRPWKSIIALLLAILSRSWSDARIGRSVIGRHP